MSSIYIHIPYCKQACSYCNFHFTISQNDKQDMLNCISLELSLRKEYLQNKQVKSIYFGGGTPSILEKDEINSIIEKVYGTYNISKNAEITLECNPDDLSRDKLIELKEAGINRLSIGIQSFNDKELKWMNRSHNAKQAKECLKIAQQVGFNNITIDLIYGLPNQCISNWEENLKELFKYNIQHFSAYALTIENRTLLKHLVNTNKIELLKEELIVEQFNLLINKSNEQSFIHYEISNFGKEGCFSKHNTAYWQNKHYLGIGPSAHSYNGKSRSWNISSNKKYIQKIKQGERFFEVEKLTENQKYNEYIFTALRTIWGVNSNQIEKKFRKKMLIHFLKEIEKWESEAFVQQADNIFTLTRKGQVFADKISSDLFIVD